MLTCEICGEELMLEEDMKTHLLLSHLENKMSCPLCSLSGVSYDELSFHISTAHPENHSGLQDSDCDAPACSSPAFTGTKTDMSESATSQSARESCVTPGGGKRHSMPPLTTDIVQSKRNGALIPPSTGTTPVRGGSSPGGAVPTISSSSTTRSTTSREMSVRPRVATAAVDDDGEDADGVTSEHNKVKQNRLSSPRKEKLFSCPMCALVCSNCFILQEHVELHLQEQNSAEGAALGTSSSAMTSTSSSSCSGGKRYECPMCAIVCGDSFSLQEHVELHLDYGAATSCAESPSSDLKLARQLQQEEDQRRREQEARQEAEEFKKLQKQFGLDSSGGYRRQIERTMERAVARGLMAPQDFHNKRAEMMESLASGVDDGRTRTQGLLGALYEYYQREARDCVHVWLCAETDHYCSSEGDKGWGCGYRNFQMLLSSLHRIEAFARCLPEKAVPSIPQVQSMIEAAWKEGLDPQGASHFEQKLQGTRAWIGATEIYALLTSLGISARITDFHQPTGPGDTHPRLFEWVKQYFSQASQGTRLPPRVVQTTQPPLYLQHQGHSRSVVGVEQKKNGSLCLLILDPGWSPADARKLLNRDSVSLAVRRIRKFHDLHPELHNTAS
ncbi:zinc finger-containing ubiquitin peptidase 1 isoform X2 [Myripristis murdjan]|uniref:zinc finger-containing ubiquitin peptidase 1 isoform X2 n=1 Tax=Myripristis murdjan TaxID=586833 RepID=UPI0011762C45|nr:zinc finger-containing ubiquitin peptidase 1 isoform X2 [Myripristis murdjan]